MDNITQLDFFAESNKPERQLIDFTQVKFVSNESSTALQMFSGFTHLRAVTFSYGTSFIGNIAEQFQDAEVVFGCGALVKYDIAELMAFQQKSLEWIKRERKLLMLVEEGRLKLRMAKEILAHEKIYIMWDEKGRSRVITGSANFSGRSFSGDQREDILYFDNDENAFKYYMAEYELLVSCSTNECVIESLYSGNDRTKTGSLEATPIAQEVLVKEAAAIVDNSGADPDEARFMTEVGAIAPKLRALNVEFKKTGSVTRIMPEKLHELIRKNRESENEEVLRRKEYPKLYIDYENTVASFNGEIYDLTPSNEEIRNDVEQLKAFFKGYEDFIGSGEDPIMKAKKTYFRFLNFMFMAPFIANLRYTADKQGYSLNYFPYFGILHGRKSAGKTALLDTVQQMMFGKPLEKVESSKFTKTKIQEYLELAACVPIHINDISKKRFNPNCNEIIKSDDDLLTSGKITHPVFVMTTNDIETFDEAIGKRIYYESTSITQKNVVATSRCRGMNEIKKKFTNAFYREYLHRMIPKVQNMIANMETLTGEKAEKYEPDLFRLSSQTIIEIIKDSGEEVPDFVYEVAYKDYFETNAMVERAKELICREWIHNRAAFKVLKNRNQLAYTAGEQSYTAKALYDSLPENLHAFQSSTKVVMDLDAAEEFFGIRFRKKLLPFFD